MIVKLKKKLSKADFQILEDELIRHEVEFKHVVYDDVDLIVTSATWKDSGLFENQMAVENIIATTSEYQLCTRQYQASNTVIDIGNDIVFGVDKTVLMAGPCSVESLDQARRIAEFLREQCDIKVFRAGAFKPRTSPYSFQGLEQDGLKVLNQIRQEFGMKIITEVKDSSHFEAVAACTDIIQVGTKAMYNPDLLIKCGQSQKPILLKRAFMATIKEFLQAADFIMAHGNRQVMLCERGIRSFEPQTRFCLDLCSAALIREITHLPIILDPSHAMGIAAQVPLITQSCAAMEVDGLLIETHYDPSIAKSDKAQTLSLDQFSQVKTKTDAICTALGRKLI